MFILIVIPKSNKTLYNSPKIFRLKKLIEKVIDIKLQYQSITSKFVYPNQLGKLKQQLITNVSVILTHLICLD